MPVDNARVRMPDEIMEGLDAEDKAIVLVNSAFRLIRDDSGAIDRLMRYLNDRYQHDDDGLSYDGDPVKDGIVIDRPVGA